MNSFLTSWLMDSQNYFKWLNQVRQNYQHFWKPFYDPYKIDCWDNLTPIEKNVWADIRYLGLPFYPQFPVNKYMVDFGDPLKRIAIEVDSKWHTDKEKDARRQGHLKKLGWWMFRVDGRNTFQGYQDIFPEDLEDLDEDQESRLNLRYAGTSEFLLKMLQIKIYQT